MVLNVQFTVGYAPYNAGEIAGFDNDTAQRLVGEGVAIQSGGGWPANPATADALSLQTFEGGAATSEQEASADHLAGTVGAPGEVVGGQ